MDRSRNIVDRFMHSMELDDEPIPKQPLIEIAGDSRVLIENHKGVTQYSREKICVKLNRGSVFVCGDGLHLAVIRKDQLVICGTIVSIHLTGGRK